MIKLLRKVLQVGEATEKYPFTPATVSPGMRGKPEYHFQSCISCGACAGACPANAITLESDPDRGTRRWAIFYGRCIFCGRCEEVCPTGAITLSQDFELAAVNRDDLITTAEFRLTKCRACGRFFAPARELTYLLTSLMENGPSREEAEEKCRLLRTCPECRRKISICNLRKATTGLTGKGVTR